MECPAGALAPFEVTSVTWSVVCEGSKLFSLQHLDASPGRCDSGVATARDTRFLTHSSHMHTVSMLDHRLRSSFFLFLPWGGMSGLLQPEIARVRTRARKRWPAALLKPRSAVAFSGSRSPMFCVVCNTRIEATQNLFETFLAFGWPYGVHVLSFCI